MRDIVRDAALLMDEKLPGWWRKINLRTLNIASGCNCVLGQTVGWTPGRIALFGSITAWDLLLGGPPGVYRAFINFDKTEYWGHEILMRRAAEVVLQEAVETVKDALGSPPAPIPTPEPSPVPEPILEPV